MNDISFMTANYVAREIGYHMTEGWMQGDNATNEFFKPIATYAERFESYIQDVAGMGFDTIDIWLGLLNWAWATDEHIQIANSILDKYNLKVASIAGGFGNNAAEFEKACQLASKLNTSIMGGMTPLVINDYASTADILKTYQVRLGIENHPEKSPKELLDKIGDGADGTIGAAVDTGWWGTYAYPADDALRELKDHLFHIHLKDVRAPDGHDTVKFGDGVVGIQACVEVIKEIGYTGFISIEHEPHEYDPTDEVKASYTLLKEWLAS